MLIASLASPPPRRDDQVSQLERPDHAQDQQQGEQEMEGHRRPRPIQARSAPSAATATKASVCRTVSRLVMGIPAPPALGDAALLLVRPRQRHQSRDHDEHRREAQEQTGYQVRGHLISRIFTKGWPAPMTFRASSGVDTRGRPSSGSSTRRGASARLKICSPPLWLDSQVSARTSGLML